MALTQERRHPDADAFIQRRLSDVVSRSMIADYEVSQSGFIPAGQRGKGPERAPRWCGAVSFDRDPLLVLLDEHNA